nr:hypothetical protein 12 [bacterium]
MKGNEARRLKAAAEFEQRLREVHEGKISLCEGEQYTNSRTKVRVRCSVDGHKWEARPYHLVNQGHGCPACSAAKTKARNDAITAGFVGQTTPDGHVVLEHVGYKATPSERKRGEIGKAVYRYRCAQCGNEKATAQGRNLKKPGHTTHCGCQSRKDNFARFTRDHAWANKPTCFYIASVWYDLFVKPGISSSYNLRSDLGGRYVAHTEYQGNFFCSHLMPRAIVWTIEQIILKETRSYCVKDEELPQEMLEPKWAGRSELRSFKCDPEMIEDRFFELLHEIQDYQDNWISVYTKYMGVK